jgi:hypothetical protein
VDVEGIRARRFKVVLDCCNGAGAVILPALLEALGCEVAAINMEPDGRFPRAPEPVADNLGEVEALVARVGAAVGFVTDPDVDRLALVADGGRAIGEDYTLALAAKLVLRHRRGTVVTNLSTSRIVDDMAEAAGARVVRAPVGEVNVAVRMREEGAVVGGEGNGGVILPELHLGRDAPLGVALILQLLHEEGARCRPSSRATRATRSSRTSSIGRPRRSTRCTRRCGRSSPTPSATPRTGCASRGPTDGCTCARAAPSRSSASSPRAPTGPRRRRWWTARACRSTRSSPPRRRASPDPAPDAVPHFPSTRPLMCGIVGYVGPRVATPLLIEGLKRLEYRGYDSAGVAVMNGKGVETRKAAGKIARLEAVLGPNPVHGTLGIAHTRWATHGPPTERNAHPHTDEKCEVAVVHNGIIENATALRTKLEETGHVFSSETDTEVLAHLVESAYAGTSSRRCARRCTSWTARTASP